MPPIVSIVGSSGAGKTKLIEHLIVEFKKRGYRIAAVKHAAGPIEIDQQGKDSWRFAHGGSDAVVLNSPGKLVLIKNMDHDPDIEETLHLIGGGFDLILAEGFKKDKAPKIEVYKRELSEDLLCPSKELSAIVTDEQLDVALPQFSPHDTQAIANFIERNFIRREANNIEEKCLP